MGLAGALALSTVLAPSTSALACTSFLLRTLDGGAVYGRTIDLMSFDLDAKTVATATLKPAITPPALEFGK